MTPRSSSAASDTADRGLRQKICWNRQIPADFSAHLKGWSPAGSGMPAAAANGVGAQHASAGERKKGACALPGAARGIPCRPSNLPVNFLRQPAQAIILIEFLPEQTAFPNFTAGTAVLSSVAMVVRSAGDNGQL